MKPCGIFLLFILTLFQSMTFADTTPSDTSFMKLKTRLIEVSPENKAQLFNKLSQSYLTIDSEDSYAYSDTALLFAKQYEDTLEMIASLNNMAEALYLLDRFDDAIKTYNKAFDLASIKKQDTLIARITFGVGKAYYEMHSLSEAEIKTLASDKFFQQLNLRNDLSQTRFFLGTINADQGNYSEALHWYYESLELAKTQNDEELQADIYNNIGILFQELGSYEKALKNYTNLLKIAQVTDNKQLMSYAYNNIGIVYYDWGKKEKALEYYQKSFQIDKTLGHQSDIAGYYNNIGIIYDDWGQSKLAIGYFYQALEIYQSFDNLEGISNAKNNIGESLAAIGKYDEALGFLKESLGIEQKLESPYGLSSSYQTIGKIYFEKGNLKQAMAYNKKCLKIADSIGLAQVQMLAYELNYKIYKQLGNYRKALEYYQIFKEKKDTIYSDRFHQRITDLQIEKELDKQEQLQGLIEKELIKKEHSISIQRIYLFIIFLLMLVFGGLVYFEIRSKNKTNTRLTETNALLVGKQKQLSQTLEELTKSESKFRFFFENSPNGILFINPDGNILEANIKFLDTLYVENHEELITVNAMDFQPLHDAGITEDIKKCLAEKNIIYNEGYFKNMMGDNIFLKYLVFPVMNSQNEVNSMIVHVEDMTPVLVANKKRKTLEAMYKILVENSLQAMLVIQDMKVIFANPKMEKLSQYRLEDLQNKGRRWIDLLIHPDDFKRAADNIHKALDGEEDKAKNQYKIIRADKEMRWMETLTSVVDFKGKPAMLIVAIDITERMKTEKKLMDSESRLRELNSMKDKFFSIVAHDLKNPFSSILGFSNLLNEAYDNFSDKQRKEFIKNICVSSENTFKLLQNLLEWSRTQTGNIEYYPEFIRIDKIIEEVINLMIPIFKNKEIELVHSIPQNLMVYADANMVRVIVRNLLSNALKFTHPKGRVELSLVAEQNRVRVLIKDNGVGITPENQKLLFRIDNQIKTPGTNHESGTGLGLLLCKEFVEKNGGRLSLESQWGKGSTFGFDLPVSIPGE